MLSVIYELNRMKLLAPVSLERDKAAEKYIKEPLSSEQKRDLDYRAKKFNLFTKFLSTKPKSAEYNRIKEELRELRREKRSR